MLSNFKNLVNLTFQVIKKCELQNRCPNEKLLSAIRCDLCFKNQRQNFHSSAPRMARRGIEEVRRAARAEAKQLGQIDIVHGVNETQKRQQGFFPMGDLSNTIMNGMAFKDIPIVFVKATRNNTIMSLINQGVCKLLKSCGTEGFKNARKGTNVAAQTVGCAFGYRASRMGFKNVRIVVKGLGPGRLSAIKGLNLGGVNVVSITDATTDFTSQRPRKQRRV